MRSRREILGVVSATLCALASPSGTFAQQAPRVPRIGFLGQVSAAEAVNEIESFRSGLRDFGYIEGKNVVVEWRWSEGQNERLPEMAAEFVRLKVDVIVTRGTPGTRVARQATATIPIVMGGVGDPVASGFVTTLARPGGNITGITLVQPEIMAKRLDLLSEVAPRARQVAVLVNPTNPAQDLSFQAIQIAAKALSISLRKFEIRRSTEFESTFAAILKQGLDGVVVSEDTMFIANSESLGAIASKQRFPSVGFAEFAESGGLIGYGADRPHMRRRAAYFVHRILSGVKPSDLPVEQPTRFRFVLNMKTAKALGVTIPQTVLVRADKVIE